MRAGTYELLARVDIPQNVILNEYIDLAKAFFDDSQPGFINGVLDGVMRDSRSLGTGRWYMRRALGPVVAAPALRPKFWSSSI